MEEDKYPAWLADKLLNLTFDWKYVAKTSIEELLANITLHDSTWYTTPLGKTNCWILVISLDAIWNKEFCHQLEDWPFFNY